MQAVIALTIVRAVLTDEEQPYAFSDATLVASEDEVDAFMAPYDYATLLPAEQTHYRVAAKNAWASMILRTAELTLPKVEGSGRDTITRFPVNTLYTRLWSAAQRAKAQLDASVGSLGSTSDNCLMGTQRLPNYWGAV